MIGTTTITITAPTGISPLAQVLEASNSLLLQGGSNVVAGTVASMGLGTLEADPGSMLNDAWSRGIVNLELGVQVRGTLHACTVLRAANVTVAHTDTTPKLDPSTRVTWNVTFPPGLPADVNVLAGQPQTLAPGSYGHVFVTSGAALTLASGTYYMTSLNLATSSVVNLDQSHGPVIIYVSDVLILNGPIQAIGGAHPNLLLAYFGGLPAVANYAFDGALLAPATTLTLAPVSGVHTGFFFAKDLQLGAFAQVQFRSPVDAIGRAMGSPVVVDNGGDPALSTTWVTTPGTYGSSGNLSLQIANRNHPDLDVTVQMVGRGLDAREVSRSLGTVHVPHSTTPTTVSVPIAQLPVQSVGTQSATTLSLSYTDGLVVRTFETQPMVHQFTDTTYTSLVVYGPHGAPILTQPLTTYFGTDEAGNLAVTTTRVGQLLHDVATANANPIGRYWSPELNALVPFTSPPGSHFGPTVVVDGPIAHVIGTTIDRHPVLYTGASAANFCFSWRVGWVDDGIQLAGVTEAVHATNGLFPARFAEAALFPAADATHPIFSGYLDQNGCAPIAPNVPNGPYTLWVVGRMQSGTTTAIVRSSKCDTSELDSNCTCTTSHSFTWSLDGTTVNSDSFPQAWGISFNVDVPNGGTLPVPAHFSNNFETNTADVAAVYGQYLVTPNSQMLPNQTYVAYSDQVCPGQDTSASPPRCLEACGENDAVYLSYNYTNATGNTPDLGNANARWKFVVAHEMGHQMQARQLGALFSYAYDRQMLNPQPPLLCDCTGLNPTGNTEHCLQSTEEQGAAQIEAFAHFSSANVWNDHSLSTCNFTYYKSFRDDSQVVHQAPYPVSCLTPVKWTENHCPLAGRAAEWDWLGFLTSISRNATAPILQADLASVYLRQCSDVGGGTQCAYTDVTPWTGNNGLNLPNAATEAFGQFDPRTTTFINTGNTYGVTR